MQDLVSLLRPVSMEEIIGLDGCKKVIKYEVAGALARNKPIKSFIIGGPPGTGKSTLASIIASYTKGKIFKITGHDINQADDLVEIASQAKDNDVIFIEEAHTVGGKSKNRQSIQAILLEWIENFNIFGAGDYTLLKAPKTCFLFATTDPGLLPEALRSRCIRLDTTFYSVEEITQILNQALQKLNIQFENEDAIRLLAQSSRGMPRIAIMQRLDMYLNVVAVHQLPHNLDSVQFFLKETNTHYFGLEFNDINYCNYVYEKMEEFGGSVSLEIISSGTGLSKNIITQIIEPYLHQSGMIGINTKGRFLTNKGYEVLGLAPKHTPYQKILSNSINVEDVKKILEDKENRKRGIVYLMESLGLKYHNTQHRLMLKEILRQCGYQSVQRAGIIPLS